MNLVNRSLFSLRGAAAVIATATIASSISAADISSHGGYVDLGEFSAPESGGEFVEVNISRNLIAIAASLVGQDEPEITSLLSGLQSIRVNVVAIDNSNRDELTDRIDRIREQVTSNGWEKVVTVHEGEEIVGVYVKVLDEELIEGVTVTVMDGSNEAVFINIVGNVRPEQLAVLGERFGINPLEELSNHHNGS